MVKWPLSFEATFGGVLKQVGSPNISLEYRTIIVSLPCCLCNLGVHTTPERSFFSSIGTKIVFFLLLIEQRKWQMQVRLNIGVDFKPDRASTMGDKKGSVEKEPCAEEGQISFREILNHQIVHGQLSEQWTASHFPLEKTRLNALIKIIGMQMNLLMFEQTPGNDDNALLSRFQLDSIRIGQGVGSAHGTVSKTRHDPKEAFTEPSRPNLAPIIDQASEKYDVDPDLIRAVIRAESNFRSDSTSPKGAMGLMQLMPKTSEELGVRNPYNPSENIMAGTRYLKQLIDRYEGHIPTALAAYNWGMGNLERHPDKLPEETKTYIARVDNYYQKGKS
jgi:Transglycosylase SLT domain